MKSARDRSVSWRGSQDGVLGTASPLLGRGMQMRPIAPHIWWQEHGIARSGHFVGVALSSEIRSETSRIRRCPASSYLYLAGRRLLRDVYVIFTSKNDGILTANAFFVSRYPPPPHRTAPIQDRRRGTARSINILHTPLHGSVASNDAQLRACGRSSRRGASRAVADPLNFSALARWFRCRFRKMGPPAPKNQARGDQACAQKMFHLCVHNPVFPESSCQ